MRTMMLACLLFLSLAAASNAGEEPGSADKERCPVCGMYLSMFADWNTTVVFKDSSRVVVGGPKDLFKYYHDVTKYSPSKKRSDIRQIFVKDYYTKKNIDARKAYYVIWSDLYGPMGHEPIPFEQERDARKFLNEHKGKEILRFTDITPKLIWALDNP